MAMSSEKSCNLCKGELPKGDRPFEIEAGRVLCGRCARAFVAESEIAKLIVSAELGILAPR